MYENLQNIFYTGSAHYKLQGFDRNDYYQDYWYLIILGPPEKTPRAQRERIFRWDILLVRGDLVSYLSDQYINPEIGEEIDLLNVLDQYLQFGDQPGWTVTEVKQLK